MKAPRRRCPGRRWWSLCFMGATLQVQCLVAPFREKSMLPSLLCASSHFCSSCCVAAPMPEKSAEGAASGVAGARSERARVAGTGLLSLEFLDDGALPRRCGDGAESLVLLVTPVSWSAHGALFLICASLGGAVIANAVCSDARPVFACVGPVVGACPRWAMTALRVTFSVAIWVAKFWVILCSISATRPS